MGKYKCKNKTRKKRYCRTYTCKYAPFVTNWSGVFLDKKSRNELKIGDIVRILFETDNASYTRYVQIKKIFGEWFVGSIDDPYNPDERWCDICRNILDYKKINYTCKECYEYHECKECHQISKHKHELINFNPHFRQDTIIRFKKSNIMEIPAWTKNNTRIIEKYKNPQNFCRGFTGYFE